MSELAFNVNGERFEVAETASFWRVRRFKPSGRGTPEVVFNDEGLPLVVPVDTEIGEFRTLVHSHAGRYRLDAIDEDHKGCDCPAAYIQLSGAAATRDGAPVESRGGGDELLREIVRTNAEMVRTIAEKFATVMESAATLLRAADGAGMPQRELPLLPPLQLPSAWRNAEAPVALAIDSDEDEEHDDSGGNTQIAAILQNVAEQAMPLVQHAIHTKFMGLTPEQSFALMGGAGAVGVAAAPASSEVAEETKVSITKGTKDNKRKRPAPPVNFMMHLAAIESKLNADESRLIREVIKQMPPATMGAWKQQLVQLTPDQAAQLVRSELQRLSATQAQTTTTTTDHNEAMEAA